MSSRTTGTRCGWWSPGRAVPPTRPSPTATCTQWARTEVWNEGHPAPIGSEQGAPHPRGRVCRPPRSGQTPRMRITDTSDLWWKNAVIYCLDAETFLDWNGDGCGDFAGLAQRVDYLAELGVTCVWLMPF